jgi:uncharacterized protein
MSSTTAGLSETCVNVDAVRRLFDAVERRDRAAVTAAYDKNIVIHEAASLPYGGDYRGHEGALRHGHGFRMAWDRFQPGDRRGLEPLIIADGDHVVVLWRHKLEGVETGHKIDLPAVSVYQMRDGKIVDSRMFHFDTAALLQFLRDNGPHRTRDSNLSTANVP